MLKLIWALIFFIVMVVAAAFGFGEIEDTTAAIARIVCMISMVLTILLLVMRATESRQSLKRIRDHTQ